MDGGGEDVYEKNEIISVVTTKKGDARLVSLIDLFPNRRATQEANTWRRREKRALTGTKGKRHPTAPECVSCTEVEILLNFYVFLLAALRFSLHGWISNSRHGEVTKNTQQHTHSHFPCFLR